MIRVLFAFLAVDCHALLVVPGNIEERALLSTSAGISIHKSYIASHMHGDYDDLSIACLVLE